MRRGGFMHPMKRLARASQATMCQTNEIGFSMCRAASGELVNGPVATGTPMSVNIPVECPKDTTFEGLFHTHPGGVALPSETDKRSARRVGAKVLCIDADGKMACFKVSKGRR